MNGVTLENVDVVLYHSPCTDGFTAAYCVWKERGDEVRYIPYVHGTSADSEVFRGKNVLLVDMILSRGDMEALFGVARAVYCLDHHETSRWAEGEDWAYIDMSFSGAMLAQMWVDAHLHGEDLNADAVAREVPKLVQYVQDRDLWRYALPNSREVTEWLFLHDFDFATWSACEATLESAEGMAAAVAQGHAIQKYVAKHVLKPLAKSGRRRKLGGFDVIAVATRLCVSDLGEMLYTHFPECIILMYARNLDDPGKFDVSLRSASDDVNCVELARQFGGGGHKRAAGFRADSNLEAVFSPLVTDPVTLPE